MWLALSGKAGFGSLKQEELIKRFVGGLTARMVAALDYIAMRLSLTKNWEDTKGISEL